MPNPEYMPPRQEPVLHSSPGKGGIYAYKSRAFSVVSATAVIDSIFRLIFRFFLFIYKVSKGILKKRLSYICRYTKVLVFSYPKLFLKELQNFGFSYVNRTLQGF